MLFCGYNGIARVGRFGGGGKKVSDSKGSRGVTSGKISADHTLKHLVKCPFCLLVLESYGFFYVEMFCKSNTKTVICSFSGQPNPPFVYFLHNLFNVDILNCVQYSENNKQNSKFQNTIFLRI